MWIRCAVCDTLFEGYDGQIICRSEECKKIYKDRKQKERRGLPQKRLDEIAAKHEEFVRLNAEAKAAGMSYGVYTEMLRQRKERERRLTQAQVCATINTECE